jgi:hypothetical protein
MSEYYMEPQHEWMPVLQEPVLQEPVMQEPVLQVPAMQLQKIFSIKNHQLLFETMNKLDTGTYSLKLCQEFIYKENPNLRPGLRVFFGLGAR